MGSYNGKIYDILTQIERFIFTILLKSMRLWGGEAFLFYTTDSNVKHEINVIYDNIFSRNCDSMKDTRFNSYRKIQDVSREVYNILSYESLT